VRQRRRTAARAELKIGTYGMATSESPAGARRRVRLAVRTAREAIGLTQGQVADQMDWSLSKIIRIEKGEVTISPNDLRILLPFLGITNRGAVDQLVQDSRIARRRRLWWDEPRFRAHLTDPMHQLVQYESEATAIRHLHAMIIPGPLQTRAYAEAVLSGYRHELSDDVIAGRLEVRMRRRAELLDRKNPPEILLLLDESVTMRMIGGRDVMAEQLADLFRLTREKRLMIRVVTFDTAAPLPLFGAYDILNLPGSSDNAVLYRETHLTDEIVENPTKVSWHRGLFDRLWNAALDETISAELIEASASSLHG
jgi:transcriptional regulator with XRE-family HTH domain